MLLIIWIAVGTAIGCAVTLVSGIELQDGFFTASISMGIAGAAILLAIVSSLKTSRVRSR